MKNQRYSLRRALLNEAPTNAQVKQFTKVLDTLFGIDMELGQSGSNLVFRKTTDNGHVYTLATPVSGRLQELPKKPSPYQAHMQGANSISAALLQNAEIQEKVIMPIVKALFEKAGMGGQFDGMFATVDLPSSIDEKTELVRLREENKQLKAKIEELQAKLNGPTSNKPRGMNKGYEDLEI
jgi:hypothetical protein